MLAAALSLCACRERADDGKIKIVCSIFPQYDFVRNIVGDAAEVVLLQKNGADMHSFEPTAKNILDISEADILVTVGGESDTWVEGVLRSAENEDITHLELFSYADLLAEETPESMREHDHGHGHDHSHAEGGIFDEHIWTSPKNAIKIVRGLSQDIIKRLPEHREAFEANTEKYISALEVLDRDFEALALSGKPFIVADRFPLLYFAEGYGLDFFGMFPGCSSETHASFESLTYLIGEVTRRGADCIFVIDGSSIGVAERVSEVTGARIYTLDPVQSISTEALNSGVGYIEIMRKNLEALTEAYG